MGDRANLPRATALNGTAWTVLAHAGRARQ